MKRNHSRLYSFILSGFLLTACAQAQASAAGLPPGMSKAVVFLLDVSNSMTVNDQERLAKDSIAQLLYSLPSHYLVGFAAYNTSVVSSVGMMDSNARILLTSGNPIQNLKADFSAANGKQYSGSHYAPLELDHPTDTAVHITGLRGGQVTAAAPAVRMEEASRYSYAGRLNIHISNTLSGRDFPRPLLESRMPLAIDLGSSNTTAGIYLDNTYFEELNGDPITQILKRDQISYVPYRDVEHGDAEPLILPTVAAVKQKPLFIRLFHEILPDRYFPRGFKGVHPWKDHRILPPPRDNRPAPRAEAELPERRCQIPQGPQIRLCGRANHP